MIAMIPIGIQRLVAGSVTSPRSSPLVSATIEMEMASRYTGKAQRTSISRERTPSVKPPKKPAMTAMIVARMQQIRADTVPIISELRPP
jgi:hypothetical protein